MLSSEKNICWIGEYLDNCSCIKHVIYNLVITCKHDIDSEHLIQSAKTDFD